MLCKRVQQRILQVYELLTNLYLVIMQCLVQVYAIFKKLFLATMLCEGVMHMCGLFHKLYLRIFNGNDLAAEKCFVQFNWTDPNPVGEIVSFNIYFRSMNGQQFVINDRKKLLVRIESQQCQVSVFVMLLRKLATQIALRKKPVKNHFLDNKKKTNLKSIFR